MYILYGVHHRNSLTVVFGLPIARTLIFCLPYATAGFTRTADSDLLVVVAALPPPPPPLCGAYAMLASATARLLYSLLFSWVFLAFE